MKHNCWEFNHCGREFGGSEIHQYGVCQSVTFTAFNGTNNGFNAGRYCWAVSGSIKDSPKTCIHHPPFEDCEQCEFYLSVKEEENINFIE